MFLLKIVLAIVGLAIIALAFICFFTELTQALGLIAGLVGAGIVFFVFKSDAVTEFLGVSVGMVDDIGFGAMVGGGILCSMEFEKLGAAMITAGWVSVGLILMQVIPIPAVAGLLEIATLPFTVACVPLLLIIVFFISLFN